MKNKYLSFVSEEHLMECIGSLYASYQKAKAKIDKKNFYSNKVAVFKLTFDSLFNNMAAEDLISSEVMRQIDKSINNSIGTFHEQLLGGIKGYEMGNLSGYDVKALDHSLFADIKNKHNTMNSSAAEALFQKLKRLADDHKSTKCYWVQILAKNSFCELWQGDINGKEYSHSRVYKISGDRFYALLSGKEDALFQLYKVLPIAIEDFLKLQSKTNKGGKDSAIDEVIASAKKDKRSVIDQITFENYAYYLGFGKSE